MKFKAPIESGVKTNTCYLNLSTVGGGQKSPTKSETFWCVLGTAKTNWFNKGEHLRALSYFGTNLGYMVNTCHNEQTFSLQLSDSVY